MNAKKAKQLRRLARQIAPGRPENELYVGSPGGLAMRMNEGAKEIFRVKGTSAKTSKSCVRGTYKELKKITQIK